MRAKAADIEKVNLTAMIATAKGQEEKWSTAGDKRVDALELELEEAQDQHNLSVKAAEAPDKRATNAVARLAESFLRITEDGESAEVYT